MKGFDAFDIVTNLLFANSPLDADTYKESEHQGLLAIVEYAACLLLRRADRAASDPEEAEFSPSGSHIDGWNEKLREIVTGSAILRSLELWPEEPEDEPLSRLRHAVISRELFLRNPVFHHQERATLERLFAHPSVGEELRRTVGFTIGSAITICDALADLPTARLAPRAGKARSLESQILRDVERLKKARGKKKKPRLHPRTREISERLATMSRPKAKMAIRQILTSWVWIGIGETLKFTVEDLARITGLPIEEVQGFLDFFSLSFGQDLHSDIATGQNPVRQRPILADQGDYLCVSESDLFYAVRPRLEEALKPSRYWETYNRVRKQFAEERPVEVLGAALAPQSVYRNVTFEAEGRGYEIDGLLLVDGVLIVVEAKGRMMTDAGRRAAPERLRSDVQRVVGEAADQLDRVRRLIADGTGLHGQDQAGAEVHIPSSRVRQTFGICVTLDDLSWVAPTLWDLADAAILPSAQELPMVVSLFDLEVISDLIDVPAIFVHYLVRRANVLVKRRVRAQDELDLFLYYLNRGLYFDEELESPEAPDVIFIASMTDELDAYYMWRAGERRKPAPKPRQKMPEDMSQALHWLNDHRPNGFVEISLMLLNMGGEDREKFFSAFRRMKKQSERDSDLHDLTVVSCQERSYGLTLMTVPAGGERRLRSTLTSYTRLKKYQTGVTMWAGLGGSAGSPDVIQRCIFLDDPLMPNDELDRLLAQWGMTRTSCEEIAANGEIQAVPIPRW